MSYQSESNWMDELDSKLRNLEELEAARAKEAWEKHVVSQHFSQVHGGPRQNIVTFFLSQGKNYGYTVLPRFDISYADLFM